MATPSTPATLNTGKSGDSAVVVVETVVVLVDVVVASATIVAAVVEGSNCGRIGKGYVGSGCLVEVY